MPFALLLSLLLSQSAEPLATPRTKNPQGRILNAEGGSTPAANATALSGKTALALCGSELKQVKLKFKDPPAEEADPNEEPWKLFALPCKASWVFHQVAEFKPGKVTLAFQGQDTTRGYLSAGTPVSFSLGKKSYQVKQEGSNHSFSIVLLEGEKRTVLFTTNPNDGKDGDASLLLAGDLNRDSQLDLLLVAGGASRG